MNDNTDLPLKLMPIDEIERQLGHVENLLDEDFGLDDEDRSDLMESRHNLFRELKRRRAIRPPVVIPEPAVSAKPKFVPCAHTRCGLPRTNIDCLDDHDSNAGMYYVTDYCSLNCFVCDLKHAWDEKNSNRCREILRRIGA
jgi:hypothetical protein